MVKEFKKRDQVEEVGYKNTLNQICSMPMKSMSLSTFCVLLIGLRFVFCFLLLV